MPGEKNGHFGYNAQLSVLKPKSAPVIDLETETCLSVRNN
jgi:hypothetical protein